MAHSWLFEPGRWAAAGSFWDGGEHERQARGTCVIRHGDTAWEIEGEMDILGDPPVRLHNSYLVDPPGPGDLVMRWRSENPAVGPLTGVFAVAGDAMLSIFEAADGVHRGSECLTRRTADRYRAQGIFTASETVISTWSMDLVRLS